MIILPLINQSGLLACGQAIERRASRYTRAQFEVLLRNTSH